KSVAKANAESPSAIIGYLQTRDHKITIKADGLYTVADKSGKVLAENVTLKELQASNPRLHGILEHAVAKKREIKSGQDRDPISPSLILPNNDARVSPAKPQNNFDRSGVTIRHNDAGK